MVGAQKMATTIPHLYNSECKVAKTLKVEQQNEYACESKEKNDTAHWECINSPSSGT